MRTWVGDGRRPTADRRLRSVASGHDRSMTPLTLYGRPDCDDTERVRLWLQEHGTAFREVNIDADEAANQFVLFINGGFRSTPTLIFGAGRRRLVLTEPTDEELEAALRE